MGWALSGLVQSALGSRPRSRFAVGPLWGVWDFSKLWLELKPALHVGVGVDLLWDPESPRWVCVYVCVSGKQNKQNELK